MLLFAGLVGLLLVDLCACLSRSRFRFRLLGLLVGQTRRGDLGSDVADVLVRALGVTDRIPSEVSRKVVARECVK